MGIVVIMVLICGMNCGLLGLAACLAITLGPKLAWDVALSVGSGGSLIAVTISSEIASVMAALETCGILAAATGPV